MNVQELGVNGESVMNRQAKSSQVQRVLFVYAESDRVEYGKKKGRKRKEEKDRKENGASDRVNELS